MTLKQLAARIYIESAIRTMVRMGRFYGWTGETTARVAIGCGLAQMIAEDLMGPSALAVLAEMALEDILRGEITSRMAPYVEFVVIEIIELPGPTE